MSNAELLRETRTQQRINNDNKGATAVDLEGLKEQMKEKKKQAHVEKAEEDAYVADMLQNSKVACILQSRQQKERRAMEKDIVNYRHQYQQPSHQGEYLNEPHSFGKNKTADVQMMLPGLVGEDPDSKSRLQRQREQLREWLIQQQSEREAERHQSKLEERRYNQIVEEINSKALQLESLGIDKRKAATRNTTEYNLTKAKTEKKQHQEQECSDKVSQADTINQLLNGADVSVAVPGLCPSSDRRVPPESLQQVFQFQKYQVEEKKQIEMIKKQEEERQDRIRLDSARSALLMERQQAKLNKQMRKHLDNTNIKLAEIQKQCKPDIERGHIEDSFFSKFNTSRR